jgi:hypothetical protein
MVMSKSPPSEHCQYQEYSDTYPHNPQQSPHHPIFAAHLPPLFHSHHS